MHSSLPKPLHRICGRPMILHVIDALAELDVERVVVVVGHRADEVIKTVSELGPVGIDIEFVEQSEQRGTGDAAAVALTAFDGMSDDEGDDVVILPGDTPLLRPATLAELVLAHRSSEAGATLLTAELSEPAGYGRIIRGADGRVAKIVEHGDADPAQLAVQEVNTSIYCFRRDLLAPALRRLSPQNAQGEYYLTDVVSVFHDAGYVTRSLTLADPVDAAGVNDRAQLAVAEAELRARINERWMRRGVTMWDPERTYIDATVTLSPDVMLLPGTILRGSTTVGEGARLGPNAVLEDCTIGSGVQMGLSSARRAVVGDGCVVDAYCVLGEGIELPPGTRLPSFSSLVD